MLTLGAVISIVSAQKLWEVNLLAYLTWTILLLSHGALTQPYDGMVVLGPKSQKAKKPNIII